jgi:hypothetical protein
MTDQPTTEPAEPAEPSNAAVPAFDLILAEIAHSLDHTEGGRVGITMTVPGGVLSGVAIPRDDWLALARDEVGEALGETLANFSLEKAHEQWPGFVEWFLHLKDAVYLDSRGTVPASSKLLVRVRLTEVTSWSLQQLG